MIRLNKNKLFLKGYKNLIPGTKIFDRFDPFMIGQTPYFFKKGKGSYSWDIDNNKYLDFHMSLGSIILGYSNEKVNYSAKKQLLKGMTFSLMNDLEIETAKKMIKMIPSAEMVRFGKNGSDVLAAGVRLARYITKRDKVISCGWHGIHDWSLANTSRNYGIPNEIKKLSLKFEFNNIESLHNLIKKNKNEVACIVMDLCAKYYPKKGFLNEVKKIAKKNKILLIFDEIITGFRLHPGGAQKYFGVTPDLSCFGKGLANGFPLSALVGKKRYMRKANDLFYSLTFAGESISLAAGSTALDIYNNLKLSKELENKGNYLINKLQIAIDENSLNDNIRIYGMPCRPIIEIKHYSKNLSIKRTLNLNLIKDFAKKKILYNGSIFICKTHTLKELNYMSLIFNEVLEKNKKYFK